MTPKFYGVTAIKIDAAYTDRGLVASRRSIGKLDIAQDSFTCVHPLCSGGEVRFKKKLHSVIQKLKEEKKKEGTYSCACPSSSTDNPALSCGAIYEISIQVEYENTAEPENKK